MEDKETCEICGSLFPSEDLEFCPNCQRLSCHSCFNINQGLCKECSKEQNDEWAEEEVEEEEF